MTNRNPYRYNTNPNPLPQLLILQICLIVPRWARPNFRTSVHYLNLKNLGTRHLRLRWRNSTILPAGGNYGIRDFLHGPEFFVGICDGAGETVETGFSESVLA